MSATTTAPTTTCGNCGRYAAVVDGWMRDFEADGFTPSERVHTCHQGEVIGHPAAAPVETIEQRMERLRRECTVSDTGEHTCMSDPEVEAHYAAFLLDTRLEAERDRWIKRGATPECVRPAGEAFGWRQGSGPCDCPPCLASSSAAWEPRTDHGAVV